MRYKLILDKPYNLESLRQTIESGSRFVVYPYCISIMFVVTLQRLSPAFLIVAGSSAQPYNRKYNRLSLLLGWWGIPWGPVRTLNSLKVSRRGGIDVTADIMLNIDEESLEKEEVLLQFTQMLFEAPDADDARAFRKALQATFREYPSIKRVAAGLFINTGEGVSPYYILGLETEDLFTNYSDLLKKQLYKQFHKHVHFELIDLHEDSDLRRLLEQQGTTFVPDNP